MNHRQVSLVDNRALVADNVEIYNLRGMDPVSELLVTYRAQNSNNTPTDHPAECIRRIMVVDGSEVIVDLTGREAVGLCYHHYKTSNWGTNNYINTSWSTIEVRIPFGRWLWDQELALDPARFKNLQIIVDTDLNGGGSACTAGRLEIMANMFDQKKINPRGYLRAREHYRYLPLANGRHVIDLPVDKVIKMVMFQGNVAGTQLIQQISRIKIAEDNDKHIFCDNDMTELLRTMSPDLPLFEDSIRGTGMAAAVTFFITCFHEDKTIFQNIQNLMWNVWGIPANGGTVTVWANGGSDFDAICDGRAPHGIIGIEFGDPWDIDDWYNPASAKELKAILTSGAAPNVAGVNRCILQQLMHY